MIIGAQLYSVRDRCQCREQLNDTLCRLRDIGYRSVQISGFDYDAEKIKQHCDSIGLHIGLTHTPISDIINHTDKVINNHKILGADVIGIGNPGGYTIFGHILIHKLLSDLRKPVEKIYAAGLKFGYHNHYKEFQGRIPFMDRLYEKTRWNFILDVGWMNYAGVDNSEKLRKYASRLEYVHLKDFRNPSNTNERIVDCCVPLYQGVTPLDDMLIDLQKAGTKVAYVEQDTAPYSGDSVEQMEISFNNLKEHGWC